MSTISQSILSIIDLLMHETLLLSTNVIIFVHTCFSQSVSMISIELLLFCYCNCFFSSLITLQVFLVFLDVYCYKYTVFVLLNSNSLLKTFLFVDIPCILHINVILMGQWVVLYLKSQYVTSKARTPKICVVLIFWIRHVYCTDRNIVRVFVS